MMNYIDISIMDVGWKRVCKFLNKIYLFTYLIDFYKFLRGKVKNYYYILTVLNIEKSKIYKKLGEGDIFN